MAKSLGARDSKQAPRFPVNILVALEELQADASQPVFFRIMAWWLTLQSWGTLRFADHRGLEPKNVHFESGSFTARLTRSKTLGSDKSVSSRMVVVDSEAYFVNRSWLIDGWKLLQLKAPYERDYLLPAPSANFLGVQCRELKYDTAFAVQTRLLMSLEYRGTRVFNKALPHYWTPHSGRNFLPTVASILGTPTQEKNFLGGWSAEGSERYNRLAKYKIAQIQRDVIKLVLNKETPDPLVEKDSLRELADFLRAHQVDEEEITRSLQLLNSRRVHNVERSQSVDLHPIDLQLEESLEIEDDPTEKDTPTKNLAREKQQAWNRERTRKLGDNPRACRAELRDSLQPGFYISSSSKKGIRTLHRLGQCHRVPGLDYMQYEYAGSSMPNSDAFDQTCSWCAKSVGFDTISGTDTSSSTEDVAE